MQILDTSVTNVILPHLQDRCRRDSTSVVGDHLVSRRERGVIPATGWLAGLFGRRRFFLICATLFVVSSSSPAPPRPAHLDRGAHLPGLGGGRSFRSRRRSSGRSSVSSARPGDGRLGLGFIFGPILGRPSGAISPMNVWRWIFYINLPVGIVGFFMASVFLFDPPYLRRAARIDWWGSA